MNTSKKYIIIIVVLLIIGGIVAAIILSTDSNDTGDFNIKYIGNASKYKDSIEKGVARWSAVGAGGITVIFKLSQNSGSTIIASTSGNTIDINEPVFKSYSSNIRVITVAHEVGHALGIGTWNTNATTLPTQGSERYLSQSIYPKTGKAYVDKVRPSGITFPGPPVEKLGGTGSALVHWSSNSSYGMQRDLMTYKINSSSDRISIVDLTFLQEIGRKADLSKAQSLNSTFLAIAKDYIYKDEIIDHKCGTCEDYEKHDEHKD